MREMPMVLDAALRCIVREHSRLSEAEPQSRSWQQQEQRGELLPATLQRPGAGHSVLPQAGYEQQRQKLRQQFGHVRQYLDIQGVQIAHDLQLDIRRAGLI